jgi:hypothetical protein
MSGAGSTALNRVGELTNVIQMDSPFNIQFTSGTTGKSVFLFYSLFNFLLFLSHLVRKIVKCFIIYIKLSVEKMTPLTEGVLGKVFSMSTNCGETFAGNPKGVTLSHHNLINNGYHIGYRIGYNIKVWLDYL